VRILIFLRGVVDEFMREKFLDGHMASTTKNERIKELETGIGYLLNS